MTRVVGGSRSGRRLATPHGGDTRPTSDRVREAIANSLVSGGWLAGDAVADLYAGSGALGIEALSRGAAHATFVESAPAALAAIERNLADLDLADVATVVAGALPSAIERLPTDLDVVFADPPYAFDRWPELLELLAPRLADDGVVVCESDRAVPLPESWEKMRERTYGGTVITFATVADTHHIDHSDHTRPGR